MKYEKLFKAYKFFFFYFVPLQAIYFLTSSYTVHNEMYLKFFSKNGVLKTKVIPLSTVFTRISAVQHLGRNIITFRTLLHLGQNVITFRVVYY